MRRGPEKAREGRKYPRNRLRTIKADNNDEKRCDRRDRRGGTKKKGPIYLQLTQRVTKAACADTRDGDYEDDCRRFPAAKTMAMMRTRAVQDAFATGLLATDVLRLCGDGLSVTLRDVRLLYTRCGRVRRSDDGGKQ